MALTPDMTNEQLRNDPTMIANYGDLFEMFPEHPVFVDKHGTIRWKQNKLQRWLCDHVNLNDMWDAYGKGAFELDELTRFYRDIGYSLSAFIEVFGHILDLYDKEDEDDEAASGS